VVALPALALGGLAVRHALQGQREATEARLLHTTRALALALDSEIETHLATARVLAASPQARSGDLEALRPWAHQRRPALNSWVIVNDAQAPGFPQLLNTSLPPGAPLPTPIPGAGAFGAARQGPRLGRAGVSNLFQGRALAEPQVAVAAPVLDEDGSVARILVLPLLPARLSNLLPRAGSGGPGLRLRHGRREARGRPLARSRALRRQPVPEATTAPVAAQSGGLSRGRGADGVEVVFAFSACGPPRDGPWASPSRRRPPPPSGASRRCASRPAGSPPSRWGWSVPPPSRAEPCAR
jgi:hypothetical protein